MFKLFPWKTCHNEKLQANTRIEKNNELQCSQPPASVMLNLRLICFLYLATPLQLYCSETQVRHCTLFILEISQYMTLKKDMDAKTIIMMLSLLYYKIYHTSLILSILKVIWWFNNISWSICSTWIKLDSDTALGLYILLFKNDFILDFIYVYMPARELSM